jgi:hypothetical protein
MHSLKTKKIINITSYVKPEGYRAMSECSKYQLLLQTDYVRLGEKYDHLYVCPIIKVFWQQVIAFLKGALSAIVQTVGHKIITIKIRGHKCRVFQVHRYDRIRTLISHLIGVDFVVKSYYLLPKYLYNGA